MKLGFARRSLTGVLAALTLTLALTSCGANKTADTTPAPGKKIHLVYIAKGLQDVYWKFVEAGARQAETEANAAGQAVEVTFDAPVKDGDADGQITMMQNYIAQKVDGIILCPIDDKALVGPATLAHQAGIPLVVGDSALQYRELVSFVRTDSFKGGQMAGDELARVLGDKGRVILLRYMQGSASCDEREAGFLDALGRHPNIKILDAKNYAGQGVDNAVEKSSNLLLAYQGQVDGVFTPNESSTNGMLLALQKMGLAGKVRFVGFDGGQQNVAGLRAGDIDALVLQNPKKIGYAGVRVLLDYLAKKPVEKIIDTGAKLATKANLDTAEIQELLTLPKK